MDASRQAPGYDLFKLIVAIILLILFFVLFQRPAPQALAPAPTVLSPTSTIASNPPATIRASATPSSTLPSTEQPGQGVASAELTSTQVQGSVNQGGDKATPSPGAATQSTADSTSPTSSAPAVTVSHTPIATEIAVPSPTPLLSSTSTPTVQPIATPDTAMPVASACEAATSRSRLQAGTRATILRRLNFRSSPGIRDNWLLTNVPGTQVEIVSGPECVPYWMGAYVWWQIKLPDGRIGWSAEGSLHGTFYFMEPIP